MAMANAIGAAAPQTGTGGSPSPVPSVGENHTRVEITRMAIGGFLVLFSVAAVVLALSWALHFKETTTTNADHSIVQTDATTVADVVGIMGTITSFLGTVIGVYFGVNVGQSGRAQSDAAAQRASASAAQANAVAAQAVDASSKATETAHQMFSERERLRAQLDQARGEASALQRGLAQLVPLTKDEHKEQIDSIISAIRDAAPSGGAPGN